MNTPATAARRIILGTGIGLLIVSGFLFSMELLPPVTCDSGNSSCVNTNSFGWAIPIFGLLFTIVGLLFWQKPDLFANLFPNLDEESRLRSHQDTVLQEELEDSKSSTAWTSLEKKLLVEKVSEEE
ncbi:MAG TPA: hypothetical protein QF644_05000 [Candidatus Poseidoniaceae archaeon]|nr:hypothetical protein [Candidatus Poseidoniaceae archaeon]